MRRSAIIETLLSKKSPGTHENLSRLRVIFFLSDVLPAFFESDRPLALNLHSHSNDKGFVALIDHQLFHFWLCFDHAFQDLKSNINFKDWDILLLFSYIYRIL